ncbi:hypothetical protein, partial [Fischerella thermalis]|uniref:hypothetical protein n=1 Tax=Fischerella thermalis TaxID=372787 RepID=UPI001CA5BDAF
KFVCPVISKRTSFPTVLATLDKFLIANTIFCNLAISPGINSVVPSRNKSFSCSICCLYNCNCCSSDSTIFSDGATKKPIRLIQ